jgi:hypothetical protein
MVHCYISCSLEGNRCNPQIDVRLHMSDFTLHCECGIDTTYGSSFKTEWEEGTCLECRECGRKYYPRVHVDIVAITERVDNERQEHSIEKRVN